MPYEIDDNTPKLFRPLSIRGVTLRNRICVSPMCLYSLASSGPSTGVLTPLYITTIGHNVFKGAALAMIEATGVQPNGRITPHCPGLWNEAQQQGLQQITDFIHSQGGLCGVQLSHAGRKSSTQPPLVAQQLGKSSARASSDDGGWPDDVLGPSGGVEQSWDGKGLDLSGGYHVPKAMTEVEIQQLVSNYARAAERAVKAGVDVLEIHAAHGYLINQFLSPVTNRRTDQYGGSFDNRVRLLLEVISAVRAVIPESMPIFVRVSASDWLEDTEIGKKLGSWTVESTVQLVKLLPSLGVDLIDISLGGNHHQARFNVFDGGVKHREIALTIKQTLQAEGSDLLIGTVGLITKAQQARDLVQGSPISGPGVDVISIGRQFLREPDWVLRIADELGVDVAWPAQLQRLRPGPSARI
ncbi:NADH oxidase [Aspergillus eucalypticola CBS 122712]|uniref:NADH oxidase n=1 Tax=Aspergillus eucalypticola (strain CBS 122712 / IBT 29274) TaxID=1448314 RepID=A0A317VHS0_ASPEC|nr:NADH oxidase [Aspergillus eucalypticola CBS 122712]PWY72568.1 NADH oxidase [Aspergillus eucalypticola CBS 122712]